MNLINLIYKRLLESEKIKALCATYAGKPAIFNTEAPDDKQEGWGGVEKSSTQGLPSRAICRRMRNDQA